MRHFFTCPCRYLFRRYAYTVLGFSAVCGFLVGLAGRFA